MVIQNTPTKIDKIASLRIGQRGENLATDIKMDVSDWITVHPDANYYCLFKRPDEVQVQPVLSSLEEDVLTWTVRAWECAVIGVGYLEVRAVNPDTGLVAKSRVIPCAIEDSVIDDEGPVPPEMSWVGEVLAAKDTAVAAKTAAEEARDTAQTTVNGAIAGIQAEGTTQVGAVQSEGTTQVGAVQAKGTEVLNSIPSDYSTLSGEVTDLKSALNQSNAATSSDIGKAHSPKTVVDGKVTEWQYVDVEAVFENVEDMTEDLNLVSGISVKTLGYYTANDGGGAYYKVREEEQDEVQDIGNVVLDNGLIAELLIINDEVFVKQFGIKDGDDCSTLFSSLGSNDKFQKIVFDGEYECSSTIQLRNNVKDNGGGNYGRITTPANSKLYDFSRCSILLKSDCNLLDIMGYDMEIVGGIFKVNAGVTFTNGIIHFGQGYHSSIKIHDCQLYGNTRYSATSSTLESTGLDTCPAVGCGIKLHGTDTSATRNATWFCDFTNISIDAFDIGVLVYIDKAQSSSFVSWFTACNFDVQMNYTGKGYVVVGNRKADTAAYPRGFSLKGGYQSFGNHNLATDQYSNILMSFDNTTFDVNMYDDNRHMLNNLGGRIICNKNNLTRKDIFGLRAPDYYNDVGRFGACEAMALLRNISMSDNKSYSQHYAPYVIENNHIIYHIEHENDQLLAYYVEYGGVPFFKIGKANVKIEFDFKFETEDTLPNNARIGFFANLIQRKHGRLGELRTPSMVAKSLTRNCIVNGINGTVITLADPVTWDTSKTYYCIPEGKSTADGFYNNDVYPYLDNKDGLPTITKFGTVDVGTEGTVTTNTITLSAAINNLCIGQGITACIWNSNLVVKASDDNLMGNRLPLGAVSTATANTFAHAIFTMNTNIMSPSELFQVLLFPYCSADAYGYDYDIYVKDLRLTVNNEFAKPIDILAFTQGTTSPDAIPQTTKRSFTPETYVIGMTYSNAYRSSYGDYVTNPSVSSSGVSFTSGSAAGYGIAFVLNNAVAGKSYEVSVTTTGYVHMLFYGSDGSYLGNTNAKNQTVTVPENTATTILAFTGAAANTAYTFTNIKVLPV